MADAVSPKETELRREFEMEAVLDHALKNYEMMWSSQAGGYYNAKWDLAWRMYKAGFEAGERKERERCAKLLDEEVKHSAYAAQLQAVIRGGESTT